MESDIEGYTPLRQTLCYQIWRYGIWGGDSMVMSLLRRRCVMLKLRHFHQRRVKRRSAADVGEPLAGERVHVGAVRRAAWPNRAARQPRPQAGSGSASPSAQSTPRSLKTRTRSPSAMPRDFASSGMHFEPLARPRLHLAMAGQDWRRSSSCSCRSCGASSSSGYCFAVFAPARLGRRDETRKADRGPPRPTSQRKTRSCRRAWEPGRTCRAGTARSSGSR